MPAIYRRRTRPLRLYVWEDFDGMVFAPWRVIQWPGHSFFGSPGRSYRVWVGHNLSRGAQIVAKNYGSPDFNDAQVRALVDLVMCVPGAHKEYGEVLFHSGNEWQDRGYPRRRRGKILRRVTL